MVSVVKIGISADFEAQILLLNWKFLEQKDPTRYRADLPTKFYNSTIYIMRF